MIKRYECYLATHYNINFTEENLGNWCKSEDVQMLEQQNQKLVELVEECIFHLDVHGKKHAVKTFTERLKQITKGNKLPEVPND